MHNHIITYWVTHKLPQIYIIYCVPSQNKYIKLKYRFAIIISGVPSTKDSGIERERRWGGGVKGEFPCLPSGCYFLGVVLSGRRDIIMASFSLTILCVQEVVTLPLLYSKLHIKWVTTSWT